MKPDPKLVALTARLIQSAINCDANESVFFARQLEHIKSKTYDTKYPRLLSRQVLPVSFEAGSGALSITYYQYTDVGVAALISNYADDLPRSDVYGKKFTSPIESIGDSWGINIQEMRSSDKAQARLAQRKANASRKAFETTLDNTAFEGDTNTGLTGFSNNANVPITTLTNGVGGNEEWRLKTPDEIVTDLGNAYAATHDATKDAESPTVLALPSRAYTHISVTQKSTASDITILQFILKNFPDLTAVFPWWKLKTAGASGVGRGILYTRDPDKVTMEIPQDFEQLPVQARNLEMITPTHGRTGGVLMPYPLAHRYIDKID
jgi:hypothetical protein